MELNTEPGPSLEYLTDHKALQSRVYMILVMYIVAEAVYIANINFYHEPRAPETGLLRNIG